VKRGNKERKRLGRQILPPKPYPPKGGKKGVGGISGKEGKKAKVHRRVRMEKEKKRGAMKATSEVTNRRNSETTTRSICTFKGISCGGNN